MASCGGRGECIQQCCCVCYEDEESVIPSDICSCGHRYHTQMIGGTSECNVYCKTNCSHNCQLVECHNYRMCGQKRPQQLLDSHNGMCMDCAVMFGIIKFLDEKDDCPICMENKDMIEISCERHTVCLDCWKNWSETNTNHPLLCPLCRTPIWN